MRSNIPEYASLSHSLYAVLEAAVAVVHSRKKSRLQRVQLDSVGWTEEHTQTLMRVKDMITNLVTLTHPNQD